MLEMSMEQCEVQLREAMRVVKLREEQMRSAALCRSSGDIGSLDWDEYAARYAAAVREWWYWQQYMLQHRIPLAQTDRGPTFVHVEAPHA